MKTYNSNLPQIELKYKKGETKKIQITSSLDIFELSKSLFNTDTIEINEELLVIFLNKSNNTIGWIRHTTGGAVSCIIDKKLILVAALNCGAQSIIIMHNHPSGNKQPSKSDIEISKELGEACEILDLRLLDSVIIGADFQSYFSFADEGLL